MSPPPLQSAQYQKVSLTGINLHNDAFRITTSKDLGGLMVSIQQVGLLIPPLLIKQDSEFTIISGFRRLAACQKLGWQEIMACKLNPELNYLDCLRLAIAENAFQRPLNLIEKSRALYKLSSFLEDAKQLTETAFICGLPANYPIINKIKNLCLLPAPIQNGILRDTISLTMANELAALEPDSAIVFARIFDQLKLSLSKQKEMVTLVGEIARRENKSTCQVLANDQLQTIIGDEDLDRGQKGRKIRRLLRQWRYPRIAAAEKNYDTHLKKLKLGRSIKLIPPKNFEGNTHTLNLTFDNLAHLKELQSILNQIIQHPSFEIIVEDKDLL